ncbi:MAG: tyrosine-type recombinase/integrase [Nitrososphaerota archaeon]|jgi:integrase|nr:tyrosine-type recombinase/integrase [Nitrososphaerota archaeon]
MLVGGKVGVHFDSCVFDKLQDLEADNNQLPKQPLLSVQLEQLRPSCPQCGCTRLYRAGIRAYYDGSQTQRWLCRECNYRFSIRPEGTRTLRDLEKRLKTRAISSFKCQRRNESSDGRARSILLTEGYNLTNRQPQKTDAQREGTPTQQEQIPLDNNGRIVQFLWEMKQNGAKDGTINAWCSTLKKLAKHTDMTPDSVKEYLAKTTEWIESSKSSAVTAYNCFLKYSGITWKAPKYRAPDKLHFIPTEAEIDSLIAGSGKVLSTFLQFLKETGARGGEAAKVQWKDVDFERKIVHINNPEKGSRARILPISNKLVAMLNSIPKKHDDKIFATFISLKNNFYRTRKGIVHRLQNPRLNEIHMHTFRHWKATTFYHQTQNIMKVQQLLGHKNLNCTLIYVTLENTLFQNTDNDYIINTAKTAEECAKLLSLGFEYMMDKEGLSLFRKRR